MMRDKINKFDFRPIGKVIKEARIKKGFTRKQVGEVIKISPRYLINIENRGQHPSVQVLYDLVNLLDLSVDGYFLKKIISKKSIERRNIERQLDYLDDEQIAILSQVIEIVF